MLPNLAESIFFCRLSKIIAEPLINQSFFAHLYDNLTAGDCMGDNG
jgi:hypothetical protein